MYKASTIRPTKEQWIQRLWRRTKCDTKGIGTPEKRGKKNSLKLVPLSWEQPLKLKSNQHKLKVGKREVVNAVSLLYKTDIYKTLARSTFVKGPPMLEAFGIEIYQKWSILGRAVTKRWRGGKRQSVRMRVYCPYSHSV